MWRERAAGCNGRPGGFTGLDSQTDKNDLVVSLFFSLFFIVFF